ncbi:FkbM family methyltransferase [Butyrivibrio sp. INlla14]|uniref:FkbM family methyltransferase n=1 Tax=Butyrivibrio sp. INlla14 TaxID=1520808 RepID=UPI00087614E3|nr:FkbM family methyltransferase [Butyrivibrio sp. INlla14]SCY73186.1 Methyltransferase FkbM domain-containing protein [Butyrivibrio sp. INlla14]
MLEQLKTINSFINDSLNYMKNYRRYIKDGKIDKSFSGFLYNQYLLTQRNAILDYYRNHVEEAKKYQHELECLKKNLPYMMTCDVDDYEEKKKLIQDDIRTIELDRQTNLFFLTRKGRKLYFKRSLDSIEKVKEYYQYLAYEQSDNSPHRYLDDSFGVEKGSVVCDCGAAEGIFGLDNIANISKLYLFECDAEWIEALEATFKPYRDKVVIIPKYVGDENSENMVTLDYYFIDKDIDFIKMDIEGAEEAVLRGAKSILGRSNSLKLAIASYHSKDAERNIRKLLKDFEITKSKGFLLHGWETAEPPFFRTGITRACKRKL